MRKKRREISWEKSERFEASWKSRVQRMAGHLEGAKSVVDYGCGLEWLREFLGSGVEYFPSDYKARSSSTIVCDYNNWEFPNVVADVGFVSGCLEYVVDPEWFVEQLATHSERIVMSYCTVDENPDVSQRRQMNWCNDLTEEALVCLCKKFKLALVTIDRSFSKNPIFILKRTTPLSEWGVLAYRRSPSGDLHNLGDYIQTLAAAALAGFDISDAPTIDRERLSEYEGRPLRLIMNGWFAHSCEALPASAKLSVEVLSFHLTRMRCDAARMTKITNWLRTVGPIGCRDLHTLNWAEAQGVPAYLSGCITPLAGAAIDGAKRSDDVIVVDPYLPPRRKLTSLRAALRALIFKPLLVLRTVRSRNDGVSGRALFESALFVGIYSRFMSSRLLWKAKWRTHMFERSSFTTEASVRDHARATLADYAGASMVVTTRIHAALPCYGMDTPVLFVHGDEGQGRYTGLIERFARVRLDSNGRPSRADLTRLTPSGVLDEPIANVEKFDGDAKREMLGMLTRHCAAKLRDQ